MSNSYMVYPSEKTLDLGTIQMSEHHIVELFRCFAADLRIISVEIIYEDVPFEPTKIEYQVHGSKGNRITDLYLRECGIGDEELVTLSRCLWNNRNLKFLNICGNQFTHEGVIAFADALKINNGLKCVDISDIHMDEEALENIIDSLKVNQKIKNFIFHEEDVSIEMLSEIHQILERRSSYMEKGSTTCVGKKCILL